MPIYIYIIYIYICLNIYLYILILRNNMILSFLLSVVHRLRVSISAVSV